MRRSWEISQIKEKLDDINQELNKIEKLILNHFTNPGSRMGRKQKTSVILAQFYLKPELTHKELQDLTGYSAGAISNTLQEMIEAKVITEYKPMGRGPHIYKMKNMPQFLTRTFSGISELYLSNKEIFQEIHEGLASFPEEIRETLLFQGVKEYTDLFLEILPVYEIFSRVTREEL